MNTFENDVNGKNADAFYDAAVAYVRTRQDTTCSGLQRHLRIGHALAMQLKERMKRNGVCDGIAEHVEPEQMVIKVVGIGGAGCNALEEMIREQLPGIETIAVNTDARGLARSSANRMIQLDGVWHRTIDPKRAHALALQCRPQLEEALCGAHLVFIAAGFGGATGTGAAPAVAQIARELGALSIGVIFAPLSFESEQRKAIAAAGMQELMQTVDAVFLPSPAEIEDRDDQIGLTGILRAYDKILSEIVGIFAHMFCSPDNFAPSFLNLKTMMRGQGRAMLGIGYGSGADRTRIATERACAALAGDGIDAKVRGLLINITVSRQSRLIKPSLIMAIVDAIIVPDAPVVIGTVFDDAMGEDVRICLVATGIH